MPRDALKSLGRRKAPQGEGESGSVATSLSSAGTPGTRRGNAREATSCVAAPWSF